MKDEVGLADLVAIPAFLFLAVVMVLTLQGKRIPKGVTIALLAFAVIGAFLDARFTLKRLGAKNDDEPDMGAA